MIISLPPAICLLFCPRLLEPSGVWGEWAVAMVTSSPKGWSIPLPGVQACADVDSSNDNGSTPSSRGAAHGAFSEDGNQKQMKLLKMCKKLKSSSFAGSIFSGGDAQASFQGPAQAICIGQPWKKGGYMAHGIALTVSSHQTSGPCLSPGRIRDR